MPGFDGTGPAGKGPMTGRGQGFCVLKSSEDNPGQLEGLAGIDGKPIGQIIESLNSSEKEVINMPFGNGTGPAGLGQMTGRAAGFCAGYPVPGYMNPVAGRVGFYGAGYGMPYIGRVNPWLRRGFAFGRGFGRGRAGGRGRGRFGFRW